jgi:GT2 family glycosyltransferase
MASPAVAVVVPVFNARDLTVRFLESFKCVKYPRYTMVVVDDGSTDGTARTLRERFGDVVVLEGDGNLWWSGATNRGVEYALARGFDYVLTINNDTLVDPDFLTHLVETAESHPGTIVGSRIHFLDNPDRVWAIGGYMRWEVGIVLQLWDCGRDCREVLQEKSSPVPVEILTGCGTLVPTAAYRPVGLYDARWCPQYHGDAEFILAAARHGFRAMVDLRAVIWNDTSNTFLARIADCRSMVLSRKSAAYWRPLLAIHARYCPRRLIVRSLCAYYARFFSEFHPRAHSVQQWFRRITRRAA